MSRLLSDHLLCVADGDGMMQSAASQAIPGAKISTVQSWFEAIDFLTRNRVTAILASAEPIERRPESAVRTLRQMSADSRIILFGDPSLEPLSRKMLEFGCDDYLITPANPNEVSTALGAPRLRIGPDAPAEVSVEGAIPLEPMSAQAALPLASLMLDAVLESAPIETMVQRISRIIETPLVYSPPGQPAPTPGADQAMISHGVRDSASESGVLHMMIPASKSPDASRHLLSHIASIVGKAATIKSRNAALQKMAITDELTGLHNVRYFRNFLSRILDFSRKQRFPVTLFIFDIDNFKQYNDRFGHQAGDEILRQTAQLMKRCCRAHDIVARIGGDEFAVVFWEKDPPRTPRQPNNISRKPPDDPLDILNRFRSQLASQDLPSLGNLGKGSLTISGGLAVFPYDAGDVESLIKAADNQLMQRAKKAGKNSVFLVGSPDRVE